LENRLNREQNEPLSADFASKRVSLYENFGVSSIGDMSDETGSPLANKDTSSLVPFAAHALESPFSYDELDDDDGVDELPVMASIRGQQTQQQQQSMEVDDEDTNQSTSLMVQPLAGSRARRNNFFVRSGTF
jgi:hypothetical protein